MPHRGEQKDEWYRGKWCGFRKVMHLGFGYECALCGMTSSENNDLCFGVKDE